MNLREQLNKIDHYCIDNDLHFYDLRSLYEAVSPRFTAKDAMNLKKIVDTRDPELISSALQTLQNESLEEDYYDPLDNQDIYDFLDSCGGYTDYNQKIEDLMDYFNLSKQDAESILWKYESQNDYNESLQEQVSTLSDLSKGDKVYVLGRGLCTISYKGKRGMKLIPDNEPVDSVVYYHPDTKKISMTKSGIYMVESLDESLQESGGNSGSRLQGKLDKFYNAIKNGKRRFKGERVFSTNKIDLNNDGTATMYVNGKAKHIKDTKKVQQILNDFKEEEEAKQQGQQPQNQQQPQQQEPQPQQQAPQQQGQEQQSQQESLKEDFSSKNKQQIISIWENIYNELKSSPKGMIDFEFTVPNYILKKPEFWSFSEDYCYELGFSFSIDEENKEGRNCYFHGYAALEDPLEDDMYDDWQMGNVGKFNKYDFDIENEPLPFESFDRKNRLKESSGDWSYNKVEEFIDNKTHNGKKIQGYITVSTESEKNYVMRALQKYYDTVEVSDKKISKGNIEWKISYSKPKNSKSKNKFSEAFEPGYDKITRAINAIKSGDMDHDEETEYISGYPCYEFGNPRKGLYLKIQDLESHTQELKAPYKDKPRYLKQLNRQPKVSSKSWGRIWNDGELLKQFEGPKNIVRQDMIEFLRSLKSTNESLFLKEDYYDSFDNLVIDSGTVDVKDTFVEKEFDEDDGWIEFEIYPGTYEYRVLDFNGFKPRELKIDGVWVDVMGDCKELEDLLNSKNECLAESLKEGLFIKHSLEKTLESIVDDFFNGRYAVVESNPYKYNIFDVHIYIMNDPHDDLTIKRFQRLCREHDIETYDYSYKNGVLYFTVEL